jgi:hypothetical protein
MTITKQLSSRSRLLAFCVLTLATCASAQVETITASFGYTAGGITRSDVQKISAVGGKFRMSIHLLDQFSIGVNTGYSSYAIDQTDQLNRWGWNFWNERYYTKIQSDMRADPSLSVQIGSVQTMDAIPALITLEYAQAIGEDILLTPNVGGGILFYTRKLYVDEKWTKVFPSANYSFTYSFRNFAPEKKENIPFAALGCDVRYQAFADVSIHAGVQYNHYNPLSIVSGYGSFPLENDFTGMIGLTFLY